MSNNFPAVPADLVLAVVQYTASFPSVTPQSPFTGTSVSMGGGLMNLGGPGSLTFQFATPGSFGTYDQTAAETSVKKVLTDVCQLIADITGQTLAQVQAVVTVHRTWIWQDAAANNATFSDSMPYP